MFVEPPYKKVVSWHMTSYQKNKNKNKFWCYDDITAQDILK
jgi:hypothetical protein